MNGKFEKNLAKGNVVKQLILFAAPVLLSNLIQSLYSVVDMVVVGNFAGAVSMSGVNIGSQVTMLITNMVFGLSVGATVLIGQYLGAGRRDLLKETIGTLFSVLGILAVVLTITMIIAAEPILRLIQTPAESFSEAKAYLVAAMLGTLFIFAYNALSAVMRGMGDSKNPLIFVSIACVVNIILDLILVKEFGWGALGAAIATVVSQAISVILCILYLKKNDFVFDFKISSFRINKERLKMLLKVGVPTSVQNIATSLSFLFLTTLVNSLGVMQSAAVGAVGKINSFAILPVMAISSSVSAMGAQNLGAGEEKRAVKTTVTGIVLSLVISVIVYIIVTVWPSECLRIFGDDAEMIAHGVDYMRAFSYDYLIVAFFFCFNGLFIGAGYTTFSLVNNALSAVFIRIPMAYLFGMVLDMGLFGVGLGAPCASLIATVVAFIFFLSGKWKVNKIVDEESLN